MAPFIRRVGLGLSRHVQALSSRASSLARASTVARGALLAASAGAAGCTVSMAVCSAAPAAETTASVEHKGRNTRILCLHGVNLNMFGNRDASIYGTETLEDIDNQLKENATAMGVEVECFQTNFEGAMVERIHRAHAEGWSAVMINAGAWTHYSYGLRDALAILSCPIIEVHMSNIHAREDMSGSQGEQIRHHSVVSPLAKGMVAGFGVDSYILGLWAAVKVASGPGPTRWYTEGPLKATKKHRNPFEK